MQLVFDARQHALPQRRELWQTALCSAYIALDAELPGTNDYQGSLSKDDFGPVSITDIRLSQHVIRRRRQHLAQLDKDCYYLQILQKGHAQLVQGRHELPSNQAVAAMFYSGEPYDLQCLADIRALYLEIPRKPEKPPGAAGFPHRGQRRHRQRRRQAGRAAMRQPGGGKPRHHACRQGPAGRRTAQHRGAGAGPRPGSGYGWRPASAGAAEPDPVLDRAASVRP